MGGMSIKTSLTMQLWINCKGGAGTRLGLVKCRYLARMHGWQGGSMLNNLTK